MTSADRGGRRGIAVIATAEDHEQAAEWQQALTAAGVMSVLHGHRTDEAEDGAEYTGVDVLVPASAMRQAREILGSEVVAPESEERRSRGSCSHWGRRFSL
jgi:hypothetical protein